MKNLMVRTHTHHRRMARLVAIVLFAALLSATPFHTALAQSAPNLGTASTFAVLGGAGVTCTDSTINGAAGSLLTVTQTATCIITGPIHQGDATAIQAYDDAFVTSGENISAYDKLAYIPCPTDAAHNLSGDLGGKTLSPGVYCISGVGLLTSKLTLDGPPNGVWIFKAASSLTPIGGSVVMAGGGQSCNVYWQTGTEVSLDATQFLGTVLAGSAISFTGVDSILVGRALAKTAVTMTGASVIGCGSLVPPPPIDYCRLYCKDYCKDYWKEYWNDHDKYHCKNHEKDYCKDHHCTDHDKDRCKDHDKDDDRDHDKNKNKNKNKDKDNRNRR